MSPYLRALLLGAAVVALALAPSPANARPTSIEVGTLRDWPPAYATTADGVPTGFAIDVIEAVAARAQLRVHYRVFDHFSEMAAALERGEIDVIPNFGISDDRERVFDFTQPVETFVISVFVRNRDRVPQRVEDLAGMQVAVVQANIAANLLKESPTIQVREYSDVRVALYDLLAGQVDALAYPKPILERIAEDAGLDERIRAAPIELAEVKRAIAVRAGQQELLGILDTATGDFVHSADYRRVYGRWYAAPVRFWNATRVAYGSAALFVLMMAGFLWFRSRARGALSREAHARRMTESKYQTLLEHASDGVFVMDRELRIRDANRRGCELLKLAREELLGRPFSELVSAQARAGHDDIVRRLLDEEDVLVEQELVRKDGQTLEVEVSSRLVSEEDVVAIVRDVSERKRAEAALRQSQKMEAIGRLAGGVAHDFNNILTVVAGYADLLDRSLGAHPEAARDIEEIREATRRGSSLSRQLLAFSRRQTLKPEILDLGSVATGLRKMLERLIGEDVQLTLRIETAARAKADRGQLEQVLLNLVVNARDALTHGGKIDVHLLDETLAASRRTQSGVLEPGRYVVLEVSDDGVGISEELRSKIFEPFFSTKPEHQGTGLDLATVLGIVQQSGGQVDVHSVVGRGTTFRIYIPVTDERAEREEERQPEPEPRDQLDAAVLVVEDEAAVRDILVRALERRFRVVREASTPAQALALARGREHFDLLVTDVVMPGMRGTDLAEELSRDLPELRVLFVSGYADGSLDQDLLSQHGRASLPKPFTVAALVTAVSELMKEDGPRRVPPPRAAD